MAIDRITDLKDLRNKARSCTGVQGKARFQELLNELVRERPTSEAIPDDWTHIRAIPRERTFTGHHPQNTENKMVFISGEPPREVYEIGDLHGDARSLYTVLRNTNFFQQEPKPTLVFAGDYLDRGKASFETLSAALLLKRDFPDNVFLLKGNHEGELFLDNAVTMRNEGYTNITEMESTLSKLSSILPLAATYSDTLFVHSEIGKLLLDGNTKKASKLSDIIENEDNVLWKDTQDRHMGEYFSSKEDFLTSFDPIKKMGYNNIGRAHSHENEVEETQQGVRVYTILSTGKGSNQSWELFGDHIPKILHIKKDGVFNTQELDFSKVVQQRETTPVLGERGGFFAPPSRPVRPGARRPVAPPSRPAVPSEQYATLRRPAVPPSRPAAPSAPLPPKDKFVQLGKAKVPSEVQKSIDVYPTTPSPIQKMQGTINEFLRINGQKKFKLFDADTYTESPCGFSIKTLGKKPTNISYTGEVSGMGKYEIQLSKGISEIQVRREFMKFATLAKQLNPVGINIYEVPKKYKKTLKKALGRVGLDCVDQPLPEHRPAPHA